MKLRVQQPKICGTQVSSPKREIQNITGLTQEIRKSQVNNINLHLKNLGENPKVRMKELINIRAEINEIES